VREQLWQLYRDLKAYKLEPTATQADDIKFRFQTMCSTKTVYATLNQALKRMGNNQHELLRVLDKPYLPLHNNLSERDIRDYVKKRKISGSTRGEAGRKCRDTYWQDQLLFHEYFHAETGQGLGASHQTGWTALVSMLLLKQLDG
jgi:hypothetical protein